MQKSSAKEHRFDLGGVEVVFSWCGDRWSHAIHFRGGGDAATWRSVEGPDGTGGDAAWPSSPVIVEISAVPSAHAVVGVGRAGKSHYSVSFSSKPADGPAAGDASGFRGAQLGVARLSVECACRIQEPPGWIGSTYERAGEFDRSASLVRIPATIDPGTAAPLPRTVVWSYTFGPAGPEPGRPHG